jgi:hypothetical protein
MPSCADYFQSLVDFLSAPAEPGTYHRLAATIAGNRQELNPFVLYVDAPELSYTPPTVTGTHLVPGMLSGGATEYFSDRVAPWKPEPTPPGTVSTEPVEPNQPFDARRTDSINLTLVLPDGPVYFRRNGNVIAQFSRMDCTSTGLVVCTSDFDRSMILVAVRQSVEQLRDKL